MSQLRKTVHEDKYPTHIVLFGGLLGGISEIITTYPLDTIKTNLQINPNKYKNIINCGKKIVHESGVKALYNGVYASLAQVGGKAAVRFTVYDSINNQLKDKDGYISNSKKLLSGVLAGAIESILWTAPTERIKILQQKNTKQILTTNQIIQKYGFFSLYKGTLSTIIKQSSSVGSRFWLYAILKDNFKDNEGNITSTQTLMIGGIAGGLSTVINHPIDVIKSNIQASGNKKISILECTKNIINQNGYSAFLNGLNARFIRVAIAQAVTFTVYENYIKLYKWCIT